MRRKIKGSTFTVFTRNWWRPATPSDGRWPDNLVPNSGGRKHTIGRETSEQDAIRACHEYNSTHKPGRFSRKAEYRQD